MSPLNGISESLNNIRKFEDKKETDKSKKVSPQKKTNVGKPNQKATVSKDSVKISSMAKELLKNPTSVETLEKEMGAIKTLDSSTLKEIHNKIEDNFYDKPEVIEKIVDDVIPEAHSTEEVEKPVETQETGKLDQVRQNIEDGKYNSETVLNKIVDRMLSSDNLMG